MTTKTSFFIFGLKRDINYKLDLAQLTTSTAVTIIDYRAT